MKLTLFKEIDFLNAVKALFTELKVPMNYVADEPTTAKQILKDTYKENTTFNLIDDVYFVGMIDDDAFVHNVHKASSFVNSGHNSGFVNPKESGKEYIDYDGILIFGITLNQRENNLLPSRSQLAEISRAFNREFYYTPVVLVFKYSDDANEYIAFANTERLKYKQEWREGEKAGKVSLLRDINIEKPHRGHEDIINQLKIPTTGKNQIDSFAKLYNYWQEVFSVSILNKKFYQDLSNWYFWAIKEVSFPNQPNILDENIDGDEAKLKEVIKEHKGKNVIRLLTRILFIWFIKEKKLIPEEIFDEQTIADKLIDDFTPQKPHGVFATGKHNSKYYRAILQNLFFATLNQEMGKRNFRNDKQHQNVTNLMRYKSYFKDPDYFVQLMEDVVPFMNGGLFECLDKPHPDKKGRQGGDIIIYTDGFSDRTDNPLVVPDYLFFDVDEDVDLSDDFGSTARVYKNAKTRGLLEILKSYKFTITENTPIEEDVALDPELLGKVFENLLASYNPETKTTARKQTGSFYTPREIVNYMVDESLIAYLKSAVSFQLTDITKQNALCTFFNPNDEIQIHQVNLPHWEQKDVWYFITFRLADSIPFERQEQLKFEREQWLKNHKKYEKQKYTKEELKEYYRLFSERVEGWLNNGYGSCVLKDEKNAKIVADALKYFENERYILDEWVVMPNHVHVLVKPLNNHKISDILHSWKSFTANEINKNIGKTGQLWMHESYDHIVRNKKAFEAIKNYIRQNPEKAGIVSGASSFKNASSYGNTNSSLGKTQIKDALDTMLHQLTSFDNINPFADYPEISKQIVHALDRAKILDPAAGSGAFPMGMLQKMVHILQKLDPDNELWKEVQLEKVMAETKDAYDIDDKKEREQKLIEINNAFDEQVNDPDFARKLYLIENCIYGVDIQPIATQISKLRFFISLVVDQKVQTDKPNFGIRPLPNLETKFVTANTLIGLEKPDVQLSLFESPKVKELEKELKQIRHKLFNAKTKATKLKYRQRDEELRNEIAEELQKNGWSNASAKQLASWDPYDQNASSPFFDPEWMFDIKDGFDVVIGNPPYVKEYTDKSAFNGLRNSECYQGKMDLWYLFGCKSIDILKQGGNTIFIATNNWVTNEGASKFRNKVLQNTVIKQFLDFRDFMIFESASIQTMVYLLEKKKKEKYVVDFRRISKEKSKKEDANELLLKEGTHEYFNLELVPNDLLDKRISFVKSENDEVLDLIFSKRNFELDKIKEVAQGIVAPQDFLNKKGEDKLNNSIPKGAGIFNLTDSEKKNLNLQKSELELVKPFYNSNELFRYYAKPENKLWVIYTGSEFNKQESMNDYPNLKQHLDKFKTIITSDNKPYGLHRARKEYFFKGEKIISQRKCPNKPVFSYTDFDCYVSQTYFVIKTKRINQKYLTALLNSSLIAFWLKNKGKMQGTAYQIDKGPILEIPIHKPSEKTQSLLSNIVDGIIYSKRIESEYSHTFEKVIDALIFNLYFPEHMKERGIDVLEYVERDIASVWPKHPASAQKQDAFETLSDTEKEEVIEQLHKIWTDPENEVVKRMAQSKEKSPDILKVILES